ncbi:hypothetical protein N7452_004274 [Penicillium brevicompactum]|uniref:Uncharacterized protein n=1 Tax=Penicillium brevicompactum TaxID=5074 RepID=A0A9W9UNA9_PENBR|nr:hypothetical protein N7452_004274 [Penicillium brevicompactum]
MLGGFRQVIQNKGASALLIGFGPTAAGYFLQGASKFKGYKFFKQQSNNAVSYKKAKNNHTTIYLASTNTTKFFTDITLYPLKATYIYLISQPTFTNNLILTIGYIIKEKAKFIIFKKIFETILTKINKKTLFDNTKTRINLKSNLITSFTTAIISQPINIILSKTNKT